MAINNIAPGCGKALDKKHNYPNTHFFKIELQIVNSFALPQ